MSVLNYATSVSDLFKINLAYDLSNIGNWADNDKRKIIFTGDKHIITHGVDLLADFNGNRGLVPNYPTSGDLFTQIGDYGILGKTGWIKLTTNHLPVSNNITTDENLIPTNSAVYNYVADQIGAGFAANDAMVFKGTIDGETGVISSNSSINGSNISDLTNYSAGWTFRISNKAGTLLEKSVEIGDLLICVSDYTSKLQNSDWQVVQTNINGLTTININNIPFYIYTNSVLSDISFYAPASGGSNLEVLIGNGKTNAPVWKSLSEITVGSATNATNAINAATALTAAKVANALTAGIGLLLTDGAQASESYDGSKALTLNLKIAQSCESTVVNKNSYLGGVCVDTTYLTLSGDGLLSIDANKFAGALGSLEALTSTLSLEVKNETPLFTLSSGGIKNEIPVIGTSGITTGVLNNSLNISLSTATSDVLGGVKLMRKALTSNITPATAPEIYGNTRNYAVDLDKDGKMFVHVPWTDSNNTWREIRINNKSISNSILNIAPSSDIVMSYENEEIGGLDDGIATISFKLGIFNLSSGEWEYDN